MALEQNEIKKVISVDLGNTTTSLKDYKKHIDELRGSLLQLDETSEEYKQISDEIYNEQQKLNEVMKVGKTQVDAEAGSYNALTKQMAELKKAWKATGDEAKRNELGGQILEINNKLKDLDASTGNYQRNVGAYEQGFSKAMGSLKDGLASSIPAFGKVNTAMKMIAANPIGLVVTALVTAFMTLKKAIAGNEEQSMRLKQAFAGFKPVIDGIKNAIAAVADAFIWCTEKISEFGDWLMKVELSVANFFGFKEWANQIQEDIDKIQEANDLIREQNQLILDRRQATVDEARLRYEIAELEKKIRDTVTYTLEERKDFISQWETKSLEIANTRLSLAEREFKAIEKANKAAPSGTPDYDKQARAEANVWNEKRAHEEELTRINKQKIRLLNEEEKENKKISGHKTTQADEAERALKAIEQKRDALIQQLKDSNKTQLEIAQEIHIQNLALLKGDLDAQALEYQRYADEIDRIMNWSGTDEIEIATRTHKRNMELLANDHDTQIKEIERFNKEIDEIYEKQYKKHTETLEKDLAGIDAQGAQEQFDVENDTEIQNEETRAQRIFEIGQNTLLQKIEQLENFKEIYASTAAEEAEIDAQMDKLKKEYANNEIKYDNEVTKRKKENIELEKQLRKEQQQSVISSTASLFGAISDMLEEGSEEQKAFAAAETAVNTLQSIMGVWAGFSPKLATPWGWAQAIATTALMGTTGAATIAKIYATKPGNASSSTTTGATVTPPQMTSVSPLLDDQADINRMNENSLTSQQEQTNMRVYVVDQDIRDANTKAEVVENNATF